MQLSCQSDLRNHLLPRRRHEFVRRPHNKPDPCQCLHIVVNVLIVPLESPGEGTDTLGTRVVECLEKFQPTWCQNL